jgi:hypothetical protein
MTTPFGDIFDLFMMNVKDWKLVNLYTSSVIDFEIYLQGFLIYSIEEFVVCKEDLSYNNSTRKFDADLTEETKTILASLMVKYWLRKETQDILQMNLKVNDRDFKTYSEAQNLREKSVHLDKVQEQNDVLLTRYELKHNDWSAWARQDFGISA